MVLRLRAQKTKDFWKVETTNQWLHPTVIYKPFFLKPCPYNGIVIGFRYLDPLTVQKIDAKLAPVFSFRGLLSASQLFVSVCPTPRNRSNPPYYNDESTYTRITRCGFRVHILRYRGESVVKATPVRRAEIKKKQQSGIAA